MRIQAINNNTSSYSINSNARITKCRHNSESARIQFGGNCDFTLISKTAAPLIKNAELKHISDILRTLGVKELEIGDNIELARLLKSALCRVKKIGFDVPTRIRCESAFFENKEKLINIAAKGNNNLSKISAVPASIIYNAKNNPIMYFNTAHNWRLGNGPGSKTTDKRHIIWHETGHFLHIQCHKNNPISYASLNKIFLNGTEKEIVRESIGDYAADWPVSETIAEIFARLMSGESYNRINPEIFNIYNRFHGPLPKIQ